MSFMFDPYPYQDMNAVNRPKVPPAVLKSIITGTDKVCRFISGLPEKHFKENTKSGAYLIAMDGYIGASWDMSIKLIKKYLKDKGFAVSVIDVKEYYKSSKELDGMFAGNLPVDKEKDPVLLFGQLYKGTMEDFFKPDLLKGLINKLTEAKTAKVGKDKLKEVIIVYGWGAASQDLLSFYDTIVYYDVTPLSLTLRARKGEFKNLGDDKERTKPYLFRRCYYIDFEVADRLREKLVEKYITYYVDSNIPEELKLIPKQSFDEILSSLVKHPFRCKPVYVEGVWGGHFIKKIRRLPEGMKNCAWVFDLIPNEVSVLVEVGKNLMEFPYLTFVKKEGIALMGKDCVERFKGIFPIRFNYDDTYHSSGNMSVQVHPTCEYAIKNFKEQFQQDESYYIVVTGHGAKTYVGLKEEADVKKFFQKARRSEKDRTPVDYDAYINSISSNPGQQYLLPAGTVHASGRNQVILEIGSCTVGSYTFKLYDYVRLNLDGNPRPIHTWHGENVLQTHRRTNWVKENLVQEPRLVRKGEGWAEYIVGEYEDIFFILRRLEFDKEIEDDTQGKFHVLTLVDGEKVRVESKEHPRRYYEQHFSEIVVVPACLGKYVIKNLGNQPVIIHKTCLK